MWCLKTIGLDGSYAFYSDSLIILELILHFKSIWFQAFLLPQWTNVTHGQIIS